jgi:hypothetical protein
MFLTQDIWQWVSCSWIASCTSPFVGKPCQFRGTGSARAAIRIREKMGLVNHATKFSKHELAPDSPEMIAFVGTVKQAGCGIYFVGWPKTPWMDSRGLCPAYRPPLHLQFHFLVCNASTGGCICCSSVWTIVGVREGQTPYSNCAV